MRKSWRWVLGLLASIILLFTLFVWDAIRRAETAIDAHERQIALDIAALRAAHARVPFVAGKLPEQPYFRQGSPKRLTQLQDQVSTGVFYDYEAAEMWDDSIYFHITFRGRLQRIPPPPSPMQTLQQLAFPNDWLRGGGIDRMAGRVSFEEQGIQDWKRILEDHRLPAEELRKCAELMDRLPQVRPPIREALEGERIMDKIRVIRVLRTRSDQNGILTRKPDWRSMFLWRIFIAKTLTSIDRMYREFASVDLLPFHDQAAAALRIHDALSESARLPPVRYWNKPVPSLYRGWAEFLKDWSLMRLATAIAWFEVEHQRFPETLEELTPKHIDRIPLNPVTGRPFFNSKGTLAVGVEPGETAVWRISRKGDK